MDYFVNQGYEGAAQLFERESKSKPPVALRTLEDRASIRTSIISGKIAEATKSINTLSSELLANNSKLRFRLQKQQFVELIRSGSTENALVFAQTELACVAEQLV